MNFHIEHCGYGDGPGHYCWALSDHPGQCNCNCPMCDPDKAVCENCFDGKHNECEDEKICDCKGEAQRIISEHGKEKTHAPSLENT